MPGFNIAHEMDIFGLTIVAFCHAFDEVITFTNDLDFHKYYLWIYYC